MKDLTVDHVLHFLKNCLNYVKDCKVKNVVLTLTVLLLSYFLSISRHSQAVYTGRSRSE